jgi:hypothetical protein
MSEKALLELMEDAARSSSERIESVELLASTD